MGDFGQIPLVRCDGSEPFHNGAHSLGFDLLDFWRWSASDVVGNVMRGRLAEYLVANAIGAAAGVREEWAPYDLLDSRGITIEVKSAAYIQSWHQGRLSTITFAYPKTLAWDAKTNRYSSEKRRQAEVYVFALLAHQEQGTLNPLDLSQWEFYVLPTAVLDRRERSQHSITLNSLRALHGEAVPYTGLREAIADAAAEHRAAGSA